LWFPNTLRGVDTGQLGSNPNKVEVEVTKMEVDLGTPGIRIEAVGKPISYHAALILFI